jgi:hypothetical protein
MRRLHLSLVALVCAFCPAILSAQTEIQPGSAATTAVDLPPNPDSSSATATPAQKPPVRIRRPAFYASARRHPLTPRDVSMREAVRALGVDGHRFVRCELKDGSHFTGGIKFIQSADFDISRGIMGIRQIKYSDLSQPPQPVPAVGEHFANGLKWTGVVAGCIAISPLVIALLPLIFAGVLND